MKLTTKAIERMDGLVTAQAVRNLKAATCVLLNDLTADGFSKEEALAYIEQISYKIANR